ncbi:MAG: TIGR03087 family PEP-CTERM/XrtA system glycosyltransferase [Candidatus Binatia bacterium]
MRILYLAHRIPYPPNKGDKIRSYHHVRHLAERHEVSLFTFVDDAADEDGAARLCEVCREVVTIRLRKPVALVRGALSLGAGRSLSEGFYHWPAMRRAIARAAAREPFDVVWAFSSVMAQYLDAARARWRVVDYVDVDSEKWRQFGHDSWGPLRQAYCLEASRLRALEARLARSADHVLFVSNAEADLFHSFCPEARGVRVIPNGVDTEYFKPSATPSAERQPTMLFTGALDYRPNIDAVLFFVREVLPLVRREIPDARFLAVGHRPAQPLLRAVETHNGAVRIAGSVPDVRPYFAEASVYVAPLRLGRGVQNKVLEAMAMRLPVVASPAAVAGLVVEEGTHALVADTAERFAAAVVLLLRDPQRAARLSAAAARLILERYTWSGNFQLLTECLGTESAAARGERPRAACVA